jgi:ubiquinone/menaquinone biosynthesis C-methylase UbiE
MSIAKNYENIVVPAIMDGWARDLAKIVTTGNEVLDVACGTGVVSRYAAIEAGPSGKISGLDLNSDMLAVAPASTSAIWRCDRVARG